jgi:hypothetical protein
MALIPLTAVPSWNAFSLPSRPVANKSAIVSTLSIRPWLPTARACRLPLDSRSLWCSLRGPLNTYVQLVNHSYYVKQALAGQVVLLQVDAPTRELLISHHFTLLKRVPLQGIAAGLMSFDDFVRFCQQQARQLMVKP